MALKNLIAQKAKLTEEAIEDIISEYARYDTEEREIVFTPEAVALSNKAKVLVFLVAQQGWPFVLDEAIDVEVTPSHMEELLGIQGGTLRPLLKDLKDRNVLLAKSGKYSIRPSSFDVIKAEIHGVKVSPSRTRKRVEKRRSTKTDKGNESDTNPTLSDNHKSGKTPRNSKHGGLSPGKSFDDLVSSGFFGDGKTLADVQERLHEQAIIINQSSLPKYLLKAIRDGRLSREKVTVGSKRVWVYKTV